MIDVPIQNLPLVATGADGTVTFTDLEFTVSGETGVFFLKYWCDSSQIVSSTLITVETSIRELTLVDGYPTSYEISHPGFESYHLYFTIICQNRTGDGVPGKYPNFVSVAEKSSDSIDVMV